MTCIEFARDISHNDGAATVCENVCAAETRRRESGERGARRARRRRATWRLASRSATTSGAGPRGRGAPGSRRKNLTLGVGGGSFTTRRSQVVTNESYPMRHGVSTLWVRTARPSPSRGRAHWRSFRLTWSFPQTATVKTYHETLLLIHVRTCAIQTRFDVPYDNDFRAREAPPFPNEH